ncbi:TatD family hydrolase [Ruminococcus sp. OA3]|uniref:TatD family hydrolase n=1 Tax=Ruminococcus sp. OA3 TaxID=2914164 RepID=UPI001F05EE51|nr:TatD family hydrolase [Ruminococcus sp. OA3]MCH1981640.1 TatD family hydrolase [Ruminococcus sp. OA3]
MIFESHAHYDDEAFDADREELLGMMRDHGVEYIVNASASVRGLYATVKLMEQYPFIYGAVGLHPDEVGDMTDELMEEIRMLCRHGKTAAVGEIGLDYYWDKEKHELQKKWFEAQMELAREEKLPLIVHSREASADTLDMVKALRGGEIGGVIHCFSYSKETAREYLDMGLYLGIGGVITFKNAKKLKEVVEYAPLSSLLLETDCPYLAPVPYRGKRNHSLYLTYVAQAIARLKGISYEEVVSVTSENAKQLFTRVK